MYSQELTIGIAHALLGDQQDDRAQHQDPGTGFKGIAETDPRQCPG